MKRTVSVLALSVFVLGVPAAAHAGGVSASINDPKGDATGGTSDVLRASADIKQVQVKAKKDKVLVRVRGVDFPDVESNVELLSSVALATNDGNVLNASFQTRNANDFTNLAGLTTDCFAVSVVADTASNRVVFAIPRSCLEGATAITGITVTTSASDPSGTLGDPSSDSVTSEKKVRLPGGKKHKHKHEHKQK